MDIMAAAWETDTEEEHLTFGKAGKLCPIELLLLAEGEDLGQLIAAGQEEV